MHFLNNRWIANNEQAEMTLLRNGVADFLMGQRQLKTIDQGSFRDPFLLKDMDKAVKRIAQAIEKQENILIHGDYDVDGISSTAVVYQYLIEHNPNLYSYIPHRLEEGYGLKNGGIEYALKNQVDLVITVDCGVRSIAEAQILQDIGIDLIVTDHHEAGETIPACEAVINPHRLDEDYPFAEFSGSGVAFKLCQALELSGIGSLQEEHYALASLGTIADVMILQDENRFLCQRGLSALNNGALYGVQALYKANLSDVDKQKNKLITAQELAYRVCPKLNAAGRMGEAEPALQLLLTDNHEEANRLVQQLMSSNEDRRDEERRVLDEIQEQLHATPALLEEKILLLRGDDWHPGVLGIVASRIKEQYHKSTVLFTKVTDSETEEEILRGSGRSNGQNLLDLLDVCSDIYASYGGHKMACGLSLFEDDWDQFYRLVCQAAKTSAIEECQEDVALYHDSFYDCRVAQTAINLEETMDLHRLEPFGHGNDEPIILFENLTVAAVSVIGKEKSHLRIKLYVSDTTIDAIAFGFAAYANLIEAGMSIYILGQLSVNEWKNQQSCQILVKDLMLAEELDFIKQEEELTYSHDTLSGADFVLYWKRIEKLLASSPIQISLNRIRRFLSIIDHELYRLEQVEAMHNVFVEAGLIQEMARLDYNLYILSLAKVEEKVSLRQTATWQNLEAKGEIV